MDRLTTQFKTYTALQVNFDTLLSGLKERKYQGLIKFQTWNGLHIYTYTHKCQKEQAWDFYTIIARGLILDQKNREIVALTFPKFFNWAEYTYQVPNLPFATFEKVDGSLCIIFYYDGDWRVATKGSFTSDQAYYAKDFLDRNIDKDALDTNITYLTELTSPKFQIVVPYSEDNLTLIGAYNLLDGSEFNTEELVETACIANFAEPKIYNYNNLNEIHEVCKSLPKNDEGFVIRFSNNFRVKIKGKEYLRIHKIISSLSPLSVWESILRQDNLEAIRYELPEELESDFDTIRDILYDKVNEQISVLTEWYNYTGNWTNKEVGLMFKERSNIPEIVRTLLFHCRNNGFEGLYDPESRMREKLFKIIRPTGNQLDGYNQSDRMQRVTDETV